MDPFFAAKCIKFIKGQVTIVSKVDSARRLGFHETNQANPFTQNTYRVSFSPLSALRHYISCLGNLFAWSSGIKNESWSAPPPPAEFHAAIWINLPLERTSELIAETTDKRIAYNQSDATRLGKLCKSSAQLCLLSGKINLIRLRLRIFRRGKRRSVYLSHAKKVLRNTPDEVAELSFVSNLRSLVNNARLLPLGSLLREIYLPW